MTTDAKPAAPAAPAAPTPFQHGITPVAPAPAAPAPVAPAAPAPTALVPVAPAPVPAAPAPASLVNIDPPKAPAYVPQKTGDPALDLANKFFAKAGAPAEALKAAEAGDFSKVKEALKGNEEAADYIAAAEVANAKRADAAKARNAEIQAIAESVAGGAEQWKAARDWAAGEATEAQRQQINRMLGEGGLQSKLAAQFIVGQYAKHAAKNAPVLQPNAAGAGSVGVQPLSPAEFQQEVARLTAKMGGRFVFNSPEYKVLEQRRAAFRGR